MGLSNQSAYEHRIPVLERFALHSTWQRTKRSAAIGDCVVWTRSVNQYGYGQVWLPNPQRKVQVHRQAWIERHGLIPDETPLVLHHCDNPPCWRDDHLFLGTVQDNVADRVSKGRTNTRPGTTIRRRSA